MKKILLIGALVISGLAVNAQGRMDPDVPEEVKSALQSKFPDINMQDVDWDKEGGNFKAEFDMQGKEHDVLFDSKGAWVSTEIDNVNISELPETVKKQLNTGEYSTWEVDDIQVKENPEEMLYEIEVEKGMKDQKLYFDKKGNQVKKKS